MKPTIVVIGSGYVGTTTSALLASCGYTVTALDIDQTKVDAINNGRSPFFEVGLSELIAHAVKSKKLSATTDENAVSKADIVFSSVGTPDNPDGSPNLQYVNQVAELVSKKGKPGALFIQKSTVPVGTGQKLSSLLKKQIYVSNPEFLREGSAIVDSIFYDRIVIGCSDEDAAHKVEVLFQKVRKKSDDLLKVAAIPKPKPVPLVGKTVITSVNSAELIKVTANAFLALKISFANSIAQLADKTNADINEVMEGVGLDARIGKAFLNAGRGYGGGCFPKDVSGLISAAVDHGVSLAIMTAADEANSAMPGYILQKVNDNTPVKDKKVTVMGLAFKAGTSDCRKSPSIAIANRLIQMGAQVTAYDPQANHEATLEIHPSVKLVDTFEQAVTKADIVFVATNWPEFMQVSPQFYSDTMSGTLVVDAMNCLDKTAFNSVGLTYIGVGR